MRSVGLSLCQCASRDHVVGITLAEKKACHGLLRNKQLIQCLSVVSSRYNWCFYLRPEVGGFMLGIFERQPIPHIPAHVLAGLALGGGAQSEVGGPVWSGGRRRCAQ